jgi:acetyl esterase/lipase
MKPLLLLALLLGLAQAAEPTPKAPAKKVVPAKKVAAEKAAAPKAEKPLPTATLANVRYGEHERHMLDFWRAPTQAPAPLLFFIHGGGWMGGDKERLAKFYDAEKLLAAGVSVVSINYRYVSQAHAEGVKPPVHASLHDAARALQFVRSKAGEWNLDKTRVVASGGSAGACTSLWLAFHDDLADPKSSDPVAHESTRLTGAVVSGAQTTLDPAQMLEWTPNSRYGAHAFGLFKDVNGRQTPGDFAAFLAKRDELKDWIAEYSPYALVSKDDPPVHLDYSAPPALGQDQKDPTHTANFGVKLQEHCRAQGVACELVYPGAPNVAHRTTHEALLALLKVQ